MISALSHNANLGIYNHPSHPGGMMNIHILVPPTSGLKRNLAALADPCAIPDNAARISQTTVAEVFSVGNTENPATAIAQAVQNDNTVLANIFGIDPNTLHFTIFVQQNVGGAFHCGCNNTTLFVDAHPQLGPSFNAAEMVEVYEATINNGWDCFHTNGEALSRALAIDLHPELGPVLAPTEVNWFNNGAIDFISTNNENDRNNDANGAGTLFLYFLHDGLGNNWDAIVQAGGATLAETYSRLTTNDPSTAFPAFLEALDQFIENQELFLPINGNPWAP